MIVVHACQQQHDGGHLGGGFQFADLGNGHAAAFAHLRHPFAQCGDGDFAADDDHGEDGVGTVQADQQDEGDGYHEFVGNGVEKGAEVGSLFPAAGEKAVKPVGYGGGGEDEYGRPVDGLGVQPAFWQVEQQGEDGNQQNAHPGEQDWYVPRHGYFFPAGLLFLKEWFAVWFSDGLEAV